MNWIRLIAPTLAVAALTPLPAVPAHAATAAVTADADALAQLRADIEQLKRSYEARLQALEHRLQAAETGTGKGALERKATTPAAGEAPGSPPPPAAPPAPAMASAPSGANAFNPALSLIVSGGYSALQRDPASWRLNGFAAGGGAGPGTRGLTLAETELGIAANIDHLFYGAANISLHPDDTVSVEEAFVQTTALPAGVQLKAGRFFSGLGYQNEQHAHVWDFVDAPLPYQAFLGGQRNEDGLQLRWLLPTELYAELGAEIGRGATFPGSEVSRNGAGAWTLFSHVGGDVGASSNWRAGLSLLQARPDARTSDAIDAAGALVTDAFSGSSRLWLLDGVWKWAPNGNATRTNFKLQGEYFSRRERGTLVVDPAAAARAGAYRSAQSGAYVQGVWQWTAGWRTGLRVERLEVGAVDYGANTAALGGTRFNPSKLAWMIDWNPSEFSRVRLQLASDRARDPALGGQHDTQLMLQYQMSLGAHGAHSY